MGHRPGPQVANRLEMGTRDDSGFGYRITLSEDGNLLATSAVYALNEQGVESGTLEVFEQYRTNP